MSEVQSKNLIENLQDQTNKLSAQLNTIHAEQQRLQEEER
jgi:hypothetical protein